MKNMNPLRKHSRLCDGSMLQLLVLIVRVVVAVAVLITLFNAPQQTHAAIPDTVGFNLIRFAAGKFRRDNESKLVKVVDNYIEQHKHQQLQHQTQNGNPGSMGYISVTDII